MSGSSTLNILLIGDIVGRPGRYIVRDYLQSHRSEYDFVVANCENASHGFGLTEKNYNELISYGIDVLTSGNHIWDRKEIFDYIEKAPKLLRPLNFPPNTPGVGSGIFRANGVKMGVLNVSGRVFMPPIESPIQALETEIKRLKYETPIVLVDFHAEATAEKQIMATIADNLGASAFIGTHTHVQTADEKILEHGCGYISDVGFCGFADGIIGMDKESSIQKIRTMLPQRYEIPQLGETELNAVNVIIDTKTGIATDIKRIKFKKNLKEN